MNLDRKVAAATALALLFVLGVALIAYFTYSGEHEAGLAEKATASGEDGGAAPEGGEKRAAWRRNLEHLLGMACKPRRTKVFVPELLGPGDARMESVRPAVLSVPRCSDSDSFCGDEYGFSSGAECRAGNVTEADFTVMHYEGSEPQYFTVRAQVHLTCECVRRFGAS